MKKFGKILTTPVVTFVLVTLSSNVLAGATYITSVDPSPEGQSPEFSSMQEANAWAFANAPDSGITYCQDYDDWESRDPIFVAPWWFWGYSCSPNTSLSAGGRIIVVTGCPDPFSTQPDGSCSLECPAGQEFDPLTGSCREDSDCECDRTPNPIDFVGGEKHKNVILYAAQGTYPLQVEFHYNNLRNLVRGPGGAIEDPSVPLSGQTTTHTTTPHNGLDYNRDIQFTPPLPDSNGDLDSYNGNVHRKWRHNFDRLLLPAYAASGVEKESETPELVKRFRSDGETENYLYNSGVYEPINAYGSHIQRLEETHPVAPYGWEVVSDDNEIETYSIDGKLLKITSPTGLSHRLFYDTATEVKELLSNLVFRQLNQAAA